MLCNRPLLAVFSTLRCCANGMKGGGPPAASERAVSRLWAANDWNNNTNNMWLATTNSGKCLVSTTHSLQTSLTDSSVFTQQQQQQDSCTAQWIRQTRLTVANSKFSSRPWLYRATTLGKLFTPTCLCRSQWSSGGMTDCSVRGCW